jgi:hypothetical protein
LRKSSTLFAVLFSIFLLTAAVSSAQVINACANNAGGLRVLGPGASCKANETALSWSIAGPQGPAGPQGAVGPEGPQGPEGPGGGLQTATFNGSTSDFTPPVDQAFNFFGPTTTVTLPEGGRITSSGSLSLLSDSSYGSYRYLQGGPCFRPADQTEPIPIEGGSYLVAEPPESGWFSVAGSASMEVEPGTYEVGMCVFAWGWGSFRQVIAKGYVHTH